MDNKTEITSSKFIEFGEQEVSLKNLIELNSNRPFKYQEISMARSFPNLTKDPIEFPYKIDVVGYPELNDAIQKVLSIRPRRINGLYQFSEGYILMAYNMEDGSYKMANRLSYQDTINPINFNNPNFIVPNILNHLEIDIQNLISTGSYNFVNILFIGENLDFLNGHKYLRNESDLNQTRLFKIDDSQGQSPLSLFKRYHSSMNVDKIISDSRKGRTEGNKFLSYPPNYSISYFGKLCLKDMKFREEVIIYNRRNSNHKNIKFNSFLTIGDARFGDSPKYPFDGLYRYSKLEKEYEDSGATINFGLDCDVPINIYNYELNISEPVTETIKINGESWIKTDIFSSYPVKDKTKNHFKIHNGIKLSEIKRAE